MSDSKAFHLEAKIRLNQPQCTTDCDIYEIGSLKPLALGNKAWRKVGKEIKYKKNYSED